jgi:2'-5' RNA ligase
METLIKFWRDDWKSQVALDPVPSSLVLTLEMDGEAFAALDDLRRRHYAPERNLVPAHVTLFHRLPAERSRDIKALLAKIASSQRPIDIAAGEPKLLERGVAIFLNSPQLNALRGELEREWSPWLDEQDRTGFRPHVTIQTTDSDSEARKTVQVLRAARMPKIRGVGLHLWRYRGGPWEHEQLFRFR